MPEQRFPWLRSGSFRAMTPRFGMTVPIKVQMPTTRKCISLTDVERRRLLIQLAMKRLIISPILGNLEHSRYRPGSLCRLQLEPGRPEPLPRVQQAKSVSRGSHSFMGFKRGSGPRHAPARESYRHLCILACALTCSGLRARTIRLRVADQQRRRGARCLAASPGQASPPQRGKNHAALEGKSCQQDRWECSRFESR